MTEIEEAQRLVELGLADNLDDALASIENGEIEETDDWDDEGEGK